MTRLRLWLARLILPKGTIIAKHPNDGRDLIGRLEVNPKYEKVERLSTHPASAVVDRI